MAVSATANGHRLVSAVDAPSGPFTVSFWLRWNSAVNRFAVPWGIGGDGPVTSGYALYADLRTTEVKAFEVMAPGGDCW